MQKHIYIDMDNVLFNFHKSALALYGTPDYHLFDREERWAKVNAAKGFYEHMDLMPGARMLMDAVRANDNDSWSILSALARRVPTCAIEKIRAMKKQFDVPPYKVHCVYEDKWPWAVDGAVLIDDKPKNIDEWEEYGGYGILYQRRGFPCEKRADAIQDTPDLLHKLVEIGALEEYAVKEVIATHHERAMRAR